MIGQLKYRYGIEPVGDIETVIVKQPVHGKILQDVWIKNEQEFPSASYRLLVYVPEKDFYGTDQVVFNVKANGKLFRTTVKINVVPTSLNGQSCNSNDDSSSGRAVTWAVAGLEEAISFDAATVETWLTTGQSALLATLHQAASLTMASAQDAVLASTLFGGSAATINLSSTAAGHSWFIDATPLDNSEFLPTAAPTIAKAAQDAGGSVSAAAGASLGDLPTDPSQPWPKPQPAYPAWGSLGTAMRLARRRASRGAGKPSYCRL